MPNLSGMKLTKRQQAKLLFARGWRLSEIADELSLPDTTLSTWKSRYGWKRSDVFNNVEEGIAARLMLLVDKEGKSNADYKEIDNLTRQMERMAKIAAYQKTGNGAVLNPKLSNRYKKDRKKSPKNLITDEQIIALEEAFQRLLYDFQKDWVDVLNGTKKHKPARNFELLKSRQIGATFIIALWALINALKTGKNKIFLSASKAQAYQFIEYIKAFVFEVIDIQLSGDPIIITKEDNTMVTLYYMGTNAKTAQGRHGDVIMDEFFWIRNFAEFQKVASGMASQKMYQRIYLSTPSTVTHDAYQFWIAKGNRNLKGEDMNVSHDRLKDITYCEDKVWRQIVTIEDAVRRGYDKFDVSELRDEYTPSDFENLFMAKFIDDASSYFPLALLEPNMIDTWQVWKDFSPMGSRPYKHPVWIGYDPSLTGDKPALAVIAPPQKDGEPYRLLERKHLDNKPPHVQAKYIKKMCERYHVEFIGIDATGMGVSVVEHVKKFFPLVHEIHYNVRVKMEMGLRTRELLYRRKLHFDAGYTDVAKSFIAIRQKLTNSQSQMTLVANRSKETGHSDLAWAVMNALSKAPLASTDAANDNVHKSRVKVYT